MDIVVEQVSKQYGSVMALESISLEVESDELFGLIGPDGAGKTTLFRILTTLLVPDQGKATVLGYDVVDDWQALRPKLGYMPGRFSLYPDLSVAENLEFFASIFGVKPADNYDLIRPIYRQLEPFESRRAHDLSGGMKQKLALSCALVHRPELLVLDEPTTGVDAVSRKEFWDMLKKLKNEGITIIVATPYMDEAARCERIGLIQEGSLLQVDTPQRIAESFDKNLVAVQVKDKYRALQLLKSHENTYAVHPFGDSIHVTLRDPGTSPEHLKVYLREKGLKEVRVTPISPTIEDRFMDLIQSKANVITY